VSDDGITNFRIDTPPLVPPITGLALAAPPVLVPPHVRDAAQAVHRALSQNPNADIRHYVTHEHGPDNLLVLKRRLGE
jgi:hypothetical protein